MAPIPPPTPSSQDRSLLTLILDITSTTWAERDLKRSASDRARSAKGKSSVGPATLDDTLSSILAFCLAFSSLNRENCVIILAVSGDEVAVVYPRKGGDMSMENMVSDPPEVGGKVDARRLHDGLKAGVAELIKRVAEKAERAAAAAAVAGTTKDGEKGSSSELESAKQFFRPDKGAAITSALSLALCLINRFTVSALGGSLADSLIQKRDEGVFAILGDGKKAAEEREQRRKVMGVLSPRILILQATEDRTRDYNAFMNCTFAAIKGGIVIDGCFIPSGIHGQPKSSSFLEQACDRTGGVFLAPPGPAQVEGALTEIITSVFLSPIAARRRLNLPTLSQVDFRAKCFETGESVCIAHVCNQCLSIFKNRPKDSCPTCGAVVKLEKKREAAKRAKLV